MRHIKNYGIVKKAMKAYFDKELEQAKRAFKALNGTYGNPKCFDKDGNCYRLSKDAAYHSKGYIVTAEDVEKARKRIEKSIPAEMEWWAKRLDAADKAGKVREIDIRVEWSRSRMYGSNPHATAWLCFEDAQYGSRTGMGEGRASGCGYDKRSAAIQEALCFSVKKRDLGASANSLEARASLDRFVIEHGEDLWKEYAIDRTPMPHFHFDGKGMSVFTRLFRQIGCQSCGNPVKDYLIDYHESPKGADVYHVIRKDRV